MDPSEVVEIGFEAPDEAQTRHGFRHNHLDDFNGLVDEFADDLAEAVTFQPEEKGENMEGRSGGIVEREDHGGVELSIDGVKIVDLVLRRF